MEKKFFTFHIQFDQYIFKLLYGSFAQIKLRVCLHTCYSSKYAFLSFNHFRLGRFLIIILFIWFFQKNVGKTLWLQIYNSLNFYICILYSMLQPTTTIIKFTFVKNKLNFQFFLNQDLFLEYYLHLLYRTMLQFIRLREEKRQKFEFYFQDKKFVFPFLANFVKYFLWRLTP